MAVGAALNVEETDEGIAERAAKETTSSKGVGDVAPSTGAVASSSCPMAPSPLEAAEAAESA
eukprot:377576-Lingulodinium_polyedra.AAC.1